MDYSDRTYAFAKWADIGSVDFSQVMGNICRNSKKIIR